VTNVKYLKALNIYLTALDQSSERLSSDVSDDAIHDESNSPNGGGGSSNGAWDDTAAGSGNSSARRKRMRSSFKHHQLKIMKSYFQTNHNPDAKELREIALKTGLMTRVIQVGLYMLITRFRRCSTRVTRILFKSYCLCFCDIALWKHYSVTVFTL